MDQSAKNEFFKKLERLFKKMKRNISSMLDSHNASNSNIVGAQDTEESLKSPKRNRIQIEDAVQDVPQPSSSTTNAPTSNPANSNNNHEILSNLVVTMKSFV